MTFYYLAQQNFCYTQWKSFVIFGTNAQIPWFAETDLCLFYTKKIAT